MVAFRIDGLELATLDDAAFAAVLEAAGAAGGAEQYPTLYSLPGATDVIDPLAVLDELGRLAASEHGRQVAVLIGSLRDDLMEAVSAAEEG